MYLLDAPSGTVFFAGDTALAADSDRLVREHAHDTGRPLDIALLPIGHAPWWKAAAFRRGHLTPADALELFERLGARYFVPYHWGTFRHVTAGAHDAIRVLRRELAGHGARERVRILEPGERFAVPPAA